MQRKYVAALTLGLLLGGIGIARAVLYDNGNASMEVSLYGKHTVAGDTPVGVDSSGNLSINCAVGCSATSGQQNNNAAYSPTDASKTSLPIGAAVLTTAPTLTNGQFNALNQDTSGNLRVGISAALPAGTNILGKVGIDQTTPGTTNGVQVNSALPAGTNILGKTGIDQTTPGTTNKVSIGTDGTVAINTALPAGTNVIGKTGIDQTTAVTTNGVIIAPSAAAAAGIGSTASTAAEATHVLKGSAGNLYGLTVTIGTVGGYLLIFDLTSAPADGAVTPAYCIPIISNGTNGFGSVGFNPGPPMKFGTGISVAFSTTGCFTKTASATAAFFGYVQ